MILFTLMLVFLFVALYATIGFAVSGERKCAIIWGALGLGAILSIPSYWRTSRKRLRQQVYWKFAGLATTLETAHELLNTRLST